jgi:hypothetical protein
VIKKKKAKPAPNPNTRGLGGRTKAGPSKAYATQKGTGALAARMAPKKPATVKRALPAAPAAAPANLVATTEPVPVTMEPVPLSDVSTKLRIQAVVRDFANQQPPPGAWGDWILVTASKYELSVDQVEHCLERLMSGFQAEVKANLHEEAMSIAKQIGNLRGKALRVLDDGLSATKEVYPPSTVDAKGNITIPLPILVTDHAIRGKFYDRVERLFGMAAPSKAEVDIHDVDRWGSLTDQDLGKIGAGLLRGLIEVSKERKAIEAAGAGAVNGATGSKAGDTTINASFEKTP